MAFSLRLSPASHLSPNSSGTSPLSPDTADSPVDDLTNDLEPINENPFACGGYADVYKYRARASSVLCCAGNCIFVVKAVRPHLFSGDKDKAVRRIRREIRIWAGLDHQNVLKLHGLLSRDNNPLPCLVSDYMENGTANNFVKKNPEANLICLICDIAKGLSYLHGKGIAHGDIKAMNILVGRDGRARIGDFGISRMLSDDGHPLECTTTDGNRSDRWMAVEYHEYKPNAPSTHGPTKPGDVWSFGCTVLELFSGKLPFHGVSNGEVTVRLNRGEAPEFSSFSVRPDFERYRAGIVAFCHLCWIRDPDQRPGMGVLEPVICSYCTTTSCNNLRNSAGSPLVAAYPQENGYDGSRFTSNGTIGAAEDLPEGETRSRSSSQSTISSTSTSYPDDNIQIAVESDTQEEAQSDSIPPQSPAMEDNVNGANPDLSDPSLPPPPSLEAIIRSKHIKALSLLNELGMSATGYRIRYTEEPAGPDHLRIWRAICHVNGQEYGVGRSGRKKEAKERAALAALQQLYIEKQDVRNPGRFPTLSCLPDLMRYLSQNNLNARASWSHGFQQSVNAPDTFEYRATFAFDGKNIAVGVGPTQSIAQEHVARQVLAAWSPAGP